MPNQESNLQKLSNKSSSNFLSARWEYLAMFNFEVDPEILQKHLPPYTEIDFFNDKAIVSVVGFLFNKTKVLGFRWPFHVSFEEVNLRYYIKHFDGSQWKRGVGFISEIVPKPLVAGIANLLYNEHYSSAKMTHNISAVNDHLMVEYRWKKRGKIWNSMSLRAENTLQSVQPHTEEEFIFEHYFGFNGLNKNTTIEYAVKHPRWEVFPVIDFTLECDVGNLYGKEFVPFIIGKKPCSVFLARGSEVSVKMPVKIRR